jgi:hypothetical protein
MDAGAPPSGAPATGDSGAPTTGDSGEQDVQRVGLPSITSSVSGLPISPVYAGALGTYKFDVGRSRKSSFHASRQSYTYSQAEVRNKYVPQRRGSQAQVAQQKTMEGTGEVFTDPLDEFKPQVFKEARRSTDIGNGADEHKRREPAGKYRGAGKEAYRQGNRGNSETSVNRQLRYSQG